MSVQPGARIPPLILTTIHGASVPVPHPEKVTHLQFRRFAGCPVCNLHLRSFAHRHAALEAAGIREVVVFHSSAENLRAHSAGLPFAMIADPAKRLYVAFGVEAGFRAMLDPRAWLPIVRGVLRSLVAVLSGREPMPPLNPAGGRWGLPADFLIASDGRVLACKYGEHASDQWSVDEILELVSPQRHGPTVPLPGPQRSDRSTPAAASGASRRML